MADYGFGEELAAARRRNGYSVQQVSNAIRIRPDILRAIEMADFSRMPAKGFARNQVSAYARFLGLDPVDLTQRFLQAYSEFEHSVDSIEYVTDYQQPTNDRAYSTARKAERMREEQKARSHINRGRRSPLNGGDSGQKKAAPSDRSESTAKRRAHDNTRDTPKTRYAAPRRGGRRHSSGGDNIGSKGFRPGRTPFWKNRKLLFIIIAIIVVLVIIFGITRCSKGSGSSATAATGTTTQTQSSTTASENSVQVTGGASSSATVLPDTSSSALTTMPDVKVQATSFSLKVSVASGESSWVQITTDGTTPIAETVDGPKDLTYTVTGTASIQVGNSGAVTVSVDGNQVALKTDDNGLGTLTLTLTDGNVVTS